MVCWREPMDFEVVGPVRKGEAIATGRAIRQLRRLGRRYGKGRWRERKGFAMVHLQDGTVHTAEIRWHEAHGIGRREMERASRSQFAVCIKNKGCEAPLEIGKLYRVIPDPRAESHGYLRIVDESGEDYGYAADRFFAIDVPKPPEKALLKTAS